MVSALARSNAVQWGTHIRRCNRKRSDGAVAIVRSDAADSRVGDLRSSKLSVKYLAATSHLSAVGVDVVTIGQYLQPSPRHLPVARYLHPSEFDKLGEIARSLGFVEVASGPFVRSSYHADEMAAHA